jgi:hypothetical protein
LLFDENQQNQQKSAKKKTYACHDILMKQLSFQRKISRFMNIFSHFFKIFLIIRFFDLNLKISVIP